MACEGPTHDPFERPTNVRYGVLGCAASMSVLLYLDRRAVDHDDRLVFREPHRQIGHEH